MKTESEAIVNTNGEATTDMFAPENLRLPQDFGSNLGVKKLITNVPCRKPHKQEFVRVRAGAEWRLDTLVFEDKDDRENYLIAPDLFTEVSEFAKPVCLRLAMNRQQNPFLWPCKLPGVDGRSNLWYDSAIQAAAAAEKHWVRVAADMSAGMYQVYQATGDIENPDWPELQFRTILELCFRDRMISEVDHPILKRLRGES